MTVEWQFSTRPVGGKRSQRRLGHTPWLSQIVQSLPKKLAEKLEKSVRSEPFLAFFAYPIAP